MKARYGVAIAALLLQGVITQSLPAHAQQKPPDFTVFGDGKTAYALRQVYVWQKQRWTKLDERGNPVLVEGKPVEWDRDAVRVEYSIFKFHLGFTRLELVDIKSLIDEKAGELHSARPRRPARSPGGERRVSTASYDIRSVAEVLESPELFVVVPAGWSSSLQASQHLGLLRVGGLDLYPASRIPALSALLCLHNFRQYPKHQHMVPVVFFMQRGQIVERSNAALKNAQACSNAVQAGPRVIEAPPSHDVTQPLRGITGDESEPRQRVIFIVDDGERPEAKGEPHTAPAYGRNGYLLITHNKVLLYDIQEMLMSAEFWPAGIHAHWAVNLAGANGTGAVANLGKGELTEIESTSAVMGSALVVRTCARRGKCAPLN